MLCYVGKATKIFFFLMITLAAVGLFVGIGLHHHSRAHKEARPTCQGGGGDGQCSPVASFPDPATAASVPPPPMDPTTGAATPAPPSPYPTAGTAATPPPLSSMPPPFSNPPADVPAASIVAAPPPVYSPPSPIMLAPGPGQA